ncbi:hypothetical protein ElyMa_002518800, partial [Elysia marginata]
LRSKKTRQSTKKKKKRRPSEPTWFTPKIIRQNVPTETRHVPKKRRASYPTDSPSTDWMMMMSQKEGHYEAEMQHLKDRETGFRPIKTGKEEMIGSIIDKFSKMNGKMSL